MEGTLSFSKSFSDLVANYTGCLLLAVYCLLAQLAQRPLDQVRIEAVIEIQHETIENHRQRYMTPAALTLDGPRPGVCDCRGCGKIFIPTCTVLMVGVAFDSNANAIGQEQASLR